MHLGISRLEEDGFITQMLRQANLDLMLPVAWTLKPPLDLLLAL